MDIGHPLATVTPTVDGDVLAVLAQNEATFTPGQLRRLLGRYSEAGIRKVLMRLTEQGVVHGDRVGNAVGSQRDGNQRIRQTPPEPIMPLTCGYAHLWMSADPP